MASTPHPAIAHHKFQPAGVKYLQPRERRHEAAEAENDGLINVLENHPNRTS
jgi:hypothetical protein